MTRRFDNDVFDMTALSTVRGPNNTLILTDAEDGIVRRGSRG